MSSTVVKAVWTEYAELVSTNGDKKWRVQINQDGQFRCNCPAYIFNKQRNEQGQKTCKHCRRCEEERAVELQIEASQATDDPIQIGPSTHPIQIGRLASEIPLPPKPLPARMVQRRVAPEVAKQAVVMLDAVLTAGNLHISSFVQRAAMVDALAAKLATFIPVQVPMEIVEVGIRRITFDD